MNNVVTFQGFFILIVKKLYLNFNLVMHIKAYWNLEGNIFGVVITYLIETFF